MLSMTISPRFSETNAAGHIGFTVIPVWCEQAIQPIYEAFMPGMDTDQWNLILANFELNCLAEIHHRSEVTIETEVSKIGNSSVRIQQRLFQSGIAVAEAKSALICFDYQNKCSQPIDERVRAFLERLIPAAN